MDKSINKSKTMNKTAEKVDERVYKDIMVTTGSSFEGYIIEEYLGLVTGQAIIGSNFLAGIASNVADASEKDMAKLDKCRDLANARLLRSAYRLEANGIIGVKVTYASFEGGSFGVVITGTAVKIKKKIVADTSIYKELFVTNYYTRVIPRPVKVILSGDKDMIEMKIQCFNYKHEDVQSIRADVEFSNLYDERLIIRNVDFVFRKQLNLLNTESEFLQTKLAPNDIAILRDCKITINKYVTTHEVVACNDVPRNIEMSYKRLESLKAKRGMDAVAKYKADGLIWVCNCGHVNEAGLEECSVCGRKQKDIMIKATFNYEEMINEMREKENVVEIKDVLMSHLKDIDNKYRMPLLEIMESGLQYEKVRGNMKLSVIEKVEKVFEEDAEE